MKGQMLAPAPVSGTAGGGRRGSGVERIRSRSEKRTDFSVAEDEVRWEDAEKYRKFILKRHHS
jgi:hypothetical protein